MTAYRLYFEKHLFTATEVEACIEERSRGLISEIKKELQSQLTRFQTNWRRLRSELADYTLGTGANGFARVMPGARVTTTFSL